MAENNQGDQQENPCQGEPQAPYGQLREEVLRMAREWVEHSKGRLPVIATTGKSGMGKSTLINNFLELKDDKKCEIGDRPDPTTVDVKIIGDDDGPKIRVNSLTHQVLEILAKRWKPFSRNLQLKQKKKQTSSCTVLAFILMLDLM